MCASHPEVKEEVLRIQQSLESLARQTSITPQMELKDRIWDILDNVNKENNGDPDDLPIINKYSDHNNWKRMVLPLIPEGIPDGINTQVLRNADGVTQILIVSSVDVPDEVHEHEKESFLVLEGECKCYIGDEKEIRLGPGGFIEIPMYTHHNVKALTPRVVAILQHIAV